MISFPARYLGQGRRSRLALARSRGCAYQADGDTNGVFYFYGTQFGTAAWTNPSTAGYLVILDVPVGGSGSKNVITSRTNDNYSTGGSAGAGNEYFSFNLGLGRAIVPTMLSYQYRNDATTFCPTAWNWEGSTDNSTWDVLASVTGQTPVVNKWVSTPVSTAKAYQFIRVRQIGNNNSGSSHMSINEAEIYGVFSY